MGRDERQNPNSPNAQLTPEQQRANEMLRAELAAQGPRLKDRFNRPLIVGAQILYHTDLPVLYSVTDIKESLDPRVPPGIWMVTLQATLVLPMQQGVPNMEAIGVVYPKEPPREQQKPAAPPVDEPPPSGIHLTDALDLRGDLRGDEGDR